MGEGPEFVIEIHRSGAFEYSGKSNAKHPGMHKGAVNLFAFDNTASVITTSGFLQLSTPDVSTFTTAGLYKITVCTDDGQETFVSDALYMPPIFWAITQLILSMIDCAKWGDEEYSKAINTFPSRLDGSYYQVAQRPEAFKKDGYF
jgi:hypothetical protein